ncbi:MAG: type VII secretion target [Segniliparus sp.]|uniref:type VII secretion target n=1 Tax=Segniliparus sp. TaxID=2804064 RepID=UPI003F3C1AA0
MSDPDGVRKHGDKFHKASEHVDSVTDRMDNINLGSSVVGEYWQEHGEALQKTIPIVQDPWRGLAKNHKNYGNNLHFAVDTYQGTDETHADNLKNTEIPDGKL